MDSNGAAQDIAAGGTPTPEPMSPSETGAKVLQSATLGFGADAAGAAFGKPVETSIRKLAQQYDDKHPLAGIAIDLATATAWSAVPGIGEANDVAKVPGLLARGAKLTEGMVGRTAVGAGVGAAAGAGAGGDAAARGKHAGEGALEGGLAAAGLGGLGKFVLKPVFDHMGFSQAKEAADAIQAALKKEKKSIAGLDDFMQKNPNARIADYSPKVADLVTKAVSTGNDAARAAQKAVVQDAARQKTRIAQEAQPMLKLKNDIRDELNDLGKDRDDKYNFAHTEIAPLTPELQQVLNSPSVKPHFDAAVTKLAQDKAMPASAMGKKAAIVPKYNVNKEIPNYILDETQRGIEGAIKEGTGTDTSGLMAARAMINRSAKPSLSDAQMAAARAQKAQDAQDWGFKYAKGLKAAPIDEFRAMGPAEQKYAQLGIANGLEGYLHDTRRMSEGQLRDLANYVKDPAIVEALGKRNASQASAIFRKEADRAKTNRQMLNGVSGRADYTEMASENAAAHIGNVAAKSVIPAGGTLLRLANSLGMPQSRAKIIIDIAAKPGGLERLKKSGVSPGVINKVANALKLKGAVPGSVTQAGRPQGDTD
jgi:hypothetical protein